MNAEVAVNAPAARRARVGWFLPAYLGTALLYGFVGYASPGYDDEFTNIELIESLGGAVLGYVQHNDVHPPGSYLLDWLLYATLRDWQLVRLAVALLTVAAIVYAVEWVRGRHGSRAGLLAAALLVFNPAMLMWCTGLRWYAFFVPVLLWLACPPRADSAWYWAKCFLGLLVLAFLGYAAFIVALPILLIYWRASPQTRAAKCRAIALNGGAALLLYAYQAFVFLTVHAPNKESQTSGLLAGLTGFAIAQFGNQGVFPLSPGGVLGAIGTAGVAFTVFQSGLRSAFTAVRFQSYALASTLLLLCGLAGKFRNLVLLAPLQALWFATAGVAPRRARQFWIFFTLLGLANLCGVINVMTHADTTKNSWNIPVGAVFEQLRVRRAACSNDLVVITYDRGLAWHAARAGYLVLSPFSTAPDAASLKTTHRCVAILNTFGGGFSDGALRRYRAELEQLEYRGKTRDTFGRDRYFALKRRLDPTYPQFLVERIELREVRGLDRLHSWRVSAAARTDNH